MNESSFRVFLVLCTSAAVAVSLGWALDKVLSKSKLRDAILTGFLIYMTLTLDSMLQR
jgi:hypothetical protein